MTYTDKRELYKKIDVLNNDFKKLRAKSEEKNILKHCKNNIATYRTKPLSDNGNINKEKPKKKLIDGKLKKQVIEKNPLLGMASTKSQSTEYIKVKLIGAEKSKSKEEKNQSNKINQEHSKDKKFDESIDLAQYKEFNSEEKNNIGVSETKIIYEEKNNVDDLIDIYNSMNCYFSEKSENFLYSD